MKAHVLRSNIYMTALTEYHSFFLSLSCLCLATSFFLTCVRIWDIKNQPFYILI